MYTGASIAADLAQALIGCDPVAIGGIPDDFRRRVEFFDAAIKPCAAAEHAGLARDDGGAGAAPGGNQAGSEITGADVFGEGGIDVTGDLGGERVIKFNGHGGYESACWWPNCTVWGMACPK